MPDELASNPIPPAQSRYERIKRILSEASAGAHPSYQGHEQFWNLPHAEFLEVRLYGIRMIAPAATPAPGLSVMGQPKSCCETGSAPQRQPGRGAASGLIIGLRGQPPFDGSQFPRLLWGGKPVSLEDIDFIEKWI